MKEVISTFEESVRRIQDVNKSKIYILKSNSNNLYKLAYKKGFYFIDYLSDSVTTAISHYNENMENLLRDYINDGLRVYEFDSLKEFAEWLVKECK